VAAKIELYHGREERVAVWWIGKNTTSIGVQVRTRKLIDFRRSKLKCTKVNTSSVSQILGSQKLKELPLAGFGPQKLSIFRRLPCIPTEVKYSQ
jgi:hypothetical protein